MFLFPAGFSKVPGKPGYMNPPGSSVCEAQGGPSWKVPENDLIQYSEIQSIPEVQSQNDILRMISYYNFITNDIFENYLDCDYTESFTTNKNGIVYFENFTYEVLSFPELNKIVYGVHF